MRKIKEIFIPSKGIYALTCAVIGGRFAGEACGSFTNPLLYIAIILVLVGFYLISNITYE